MTHKKHIQNEINPPPAHSHTSHTQTHVHIDHNSLTPISPLNINILSKHSGSNTTAYNQLIHAKQKPEHDTRKCKWRRIESIFFLNVSVETTEENETKKKQKNRKHKLFPHLFKISYFLVLFICFYLTHKLFLIFECLYYYFIFSFNCRNKNQTKQQST